MAPLLKTVQGSSAVLVSIGQIFSRCIDCCRKWPVTRDLARDWRKWTTAERIVAAGLIAITPILVPLFYYGR